MKKSKLPVIDIQKGIVEGELSLKPNELKFGEFIMNITKTIEKFEVKEDGSLEQIDIKKEDGEVISETDYVIVLGRKEKIKLKFLRTPEDVEKGVELVAKILSYQLSADTADIALPEKWVIAKDMLPLLTDFVQLASFGLKIDDGEIIASQDSLEFFSQYININEPILKQAMVFLARKRV